MNVRSGLRLVPLLLGVLLVAAFVARIGVRSILEQLSQLGPGALAVVVPYAAGTALSGLPWAWLLEPRKRPSASAAIASRFAASGANSLLPLFGVAGEPCRLLWLPSAARAEGLAAIVVDRLLYNAVNGLWLLLGAVAAFATRLPPLTSGLAAAVGVGMFGFSLLALRAVARWKLAHGLQRLLRRLLGNAYRDPEIAARVDTALQRLLEAPARPLLVKGLLVHCAARVFISAEVLVALWSLRAPTTFTEALVLSSVPIATSVVASSIPSQMGIQEGAQAFICAALGHDPALGLVLVLLGRLRQLVFLPLTLGLLAAARPPTVVASAAPAAGAREGERPAL
ncbi:MAG TPA: lysylphosphatidylglycerol synthase domain-containing protein [Polyangiaceae bacterium]|nr:lysylphosphatidylglycerol synthase domain-containing protein [Polyangiaceae bacterium]